MKNTSNSVLDFAVPVWAEGMSALVAIGRNLLVNETKFVRSKEEEGGEADRSPSMLLTTYYSPSLRTSQSGLVSGLCCSLHPSPWLSAVTPLKRVLAARYDS